MYLVHFIDAFRLFGWNYPLKLSTLCKQSAVKVSLKINFMLQFNIMFFSVPQVVIKRYILQCAVTPIVKNTHTPRGGVTKTLVFQHGV